jgi:hypothetical protein
LSERAANNQGVIGTGSGANPYGNNDNNALPHLHSSAPWPVSLMASGVRPGVVNPGSTAVLGAIPQAGKGHSYWGGAAGGGEPIGSVPPSGGGGGGSPGGIAGDYQINDGAGGFGGASMNQPRDGQAFFVPTNSADSADFILQDNAKDASIELFVTHNGINASITLEDNATGTTEISSRTGVNANNGIFDNSVRQFLGVFIVGALPGGSNAGDTAAVSDATAPVLGAAPVGSGAVFCRVIWTGSIWVCG